MIVLSHKVLKRGCRQIIARAPTVSSSEVPAFVGYCLAYVKILMHHHHLEEDNLFPALKDKIPALQQRLEEHEAMMGSINAFTAYLTALSPGTPAATVAATPSPATPPPATPTPTATPAAASGGGGGGSAKQAFDATTFVSLVTPIQDFVVPHLAAEEVDLTAATLKAAGVTEDEVKEILKKMTEQGMKADKTVELAFMLRHFSSEERSIFFAEVPWLVRKVIFPSFTLRHNKYWKHASAKEE
ncbi:hypothetical protein DFJ73DRAFT_498850 [Zopfochytrium polystomum]|nr:hypothetical protein DFJ73DRAFT_498850 [Zopfochytrium polystomum]